MQSIETLLSSVIQRLIYKKKTAEAVFQPIFNIAAQNL